MLSARLSEDMDEEMMDEVRVARTGTKKQAPEIDPEDFLPT
jgi:hypothetical protein